MLYDILIVDDDFGAKSDSREWSDNANKLLCDLVRLNLRVTWTTGEDEDLKKLKKKDLSEIKYIVLDLHLAGIKANHSYTIINSKLIRILRKLVKHIKKEDVICLINSKYKDKDQGYGSIGKRDLQTKLSGIKRTSKYSVEFIIRKKNALSRNQKNMIIKNNLDIYTKNFIINKATDVDKIFDYKLKLCVEAKEGVFFDHKKLIFKSQYEMDEETIKQTNLLQQMRNKCAHENGDLSTIKYKKMKKTFWQIVAGKKNSKNIHFEDFAALMKYIDSVDELCKKLKNADASQEK